MKIFKLILLPTAILLACGSGTSLFAPPATPVPTYYEFFPLGGDPGFSGIIGVDSTSNPSGTSADVIDWKITDPMGTFTPGNSTLESGGVIDWDPNAILSMKLEFDVAGVPSFGINTTNIFEGSTAPAQGHSGPWLNIPETSNGLLLLLGGIGGLVVFRYATNADKKKIAI